MDPLLYRKKGINVTCSAIEGLVAVVNRVIYSVPVPGSTLYVHACHPAVPYLLLGLQDVQWAMKNSRGARKLARTPHINKKKKRYKWISFGRNTLPFSLNSPYPIIECALIVFFYLKGV